MCSLLIHVVVVVCVRVCMYDYVTIIIIVNITFYRTVQYITVRTCLRILSHTHAPTVWPIDLYKLYAADRS